MNFRTGLIILMGIALGLSLAACENDHEASNPTAPEQGIAFPDPWSPEGAATRDKVLGSVSGTTSRVTVVSLFDFNNYGTKQDPQPEHGFLRAWNPGNPTNACEEPFGPFAFSIWGQSYCHFKILDENGDCILFNSSLWGVNDTGWATIRFGLPVGEEPSTANIVFDPSSDYESILLTGYYQEADFVLEKGATYTFQITEQVAGVGTSHDGELVRFEQQFTVPCCVGMRGNVNGDPEDQVDISDLLALVDYMFHGIEIPCLDEADVDGNGQVDISDLDYMVNYMFEGGPAPVACDYP